MMPALQPNPLLVAVVQALASAKKPLDAYDLARLTRGAPMEVGRTLDRLEDQAKVRRVDPDEGNPLAHRFERNSG